MEQKELYDLIKIIDDSQLAYFEFKNKDLYIKMDKSYNRNSVERPVQKEDPIQEEKVYTKQPESEVKESAVKENKEVAVDSNAHIVSSPMVGTLYTKPAPDKDPYITVGSRVKKGQVICIIEAMKLMNEIEADADGEVLEILVSEGQMVEYGTPLIKIRK